MRRPPIPPLCGGAGSSSTKFPHDSSRPPTPSFPPYDVRTLHFVACGRPWLLHWRGVHTHRRWSLFWGAHVPRILKEVQETCQTDHARAAVRACGPRGIFCKGFVPSAHDRSIAGAPRGEMKSVDLPEFLRILWFLYDFSMSARTRNLKSFC